MKPSIIINKLKRTLIYSIWLVLWQIAYLCIDKEVLIPSPMHTFTKLLEMLTTTVFYLQIAGTFYRVFMGVGSSLILGIVSAYLAYKSLFFRTFIKPMVNFMKSTPVMAIIILALLWFKSEEVPIFVCFLMCYPLVYTNILNGLLELSQELKELSKVYEVKAFYYIKECVLPQLRPYLRTAMQLVVGMAFKVVIAAEVLAIPKYAMGYELLDAKIYLETTEVFAWIIVIILLSQFCEYIVDLLFKERRKV